MTEIVAVDIGGTNARFARASIGDDGGISVGKTISLKTSDFASLRTAWHAAAKQLCQEMPRAAAIAIAGPVNSEFVRMTNNSWVLQLNELSAQLQVDRLTVLNDFGAVAHAVARAPKESLIHICGPEIDLPPHGTTTIVGPGTGLGVAHVLRTRQGYFVQATEGGHTEFAPIDRVDDILLERLRSRHLRVSTERVHSGPGIVEIYEALAALEGAQVPSLNDTQIWEHGCSGEDALSEAAVLRFCQSLGTLVGDYALAQGANGVVLAGGFSERREGMIKRSGFAERFCAKGRYQQMMSGIPIKLLKHEQPGLWGAAAAFAAEHETFEPE